MSRWLPAAERQSRLTGCARAPLPDEKVVGGALSEEVVLIGYVVLFERSGAFHDDALTIRDGDDEEQVGWQQSLAAQIGEHMVLGIV